MKNVISVFYQIWDIQRKKLYIRKRKKSLMLKAVQCPTEENLTLKACKSWTDSDIKSKGVITQMKAARWVHSNGRAVGSCWTENFWCHLAECWENNALKFTGIQTVLGSFHWRLHNIFCYTTDNANEQCSEKLISSQRKFVLYIFLKYLKHGKCSF